jgi:hypothetical protein
LPGLIARKVLLRCCGFGLSAAIVRWPQVCRYRVSVFAGVRGASLEQPMTVSEDFTGVVGRLRGESLAHCYRMVGSAEEAEDLVQE